MGKTNEKLKVIKGKNQNERDLLNLIFKPGVNDEKEYKKALDKLEPKGQVSLVTCKKEH